MRVGRVSSGVWVVDGGLMRDGEGCIDGVLVGRTDCNGIPVGEGLDADAGAYADADWDGDLDSGGLYGRYRVVA